MDFTRLLYVISILFIITLTSEIIIKDFFKPHKLFIYILLTTIMSGLTATYILETHDVKFILD